MDLLLFQWIPALIALVSFFINIGLINKRTDGLVTKEEFLKFQLEAERNYATSSELTHIMTDLKSAINNFTADVKVLTANFTETTSSHNLAIQGLRQDMEYMRQRR